MKRRLMWAMVHKDGSTACIEQVGPDEFIVTREGNGVVVSFKCDVQGATDIYQDLVEEGYQIVQKGDK